MKTGNFINFIFLNFLQVILLIFGNINFTTSQSIQKHIKNLHLDFLKN